jgi:hypothetical protein
MTNMEAAIVANGNNALSAQEALSALTAADKGNSGTGTGAVLTGTGLVDCKAELGFIPRMAYIGTDGYFGFKTLDDKSHRLPVKAGAWVGPIWMPYIYESSHASLSTTSTVFLF